MSNASRFIIRTAIVGLLAATPVGSAMGQQQPAEPVSNAAQQLVRAAVDGQPVGSPASMATAPVIVETVTRQATEIGAQIHRQVTEAQTLEQEAAELRPGQFIWQPGRAATGDVQVVVSLAEQKAYVYRAGTLIGVTTVSTGMRGHRTPTGSFTILQKNRRHFSNLYNNAPMPNMQRLTWDGIALHAGALPGYPASHGCVRLPMAFSRILFEATDMGGQVHIIADSPPSAAGALAHATGGPGGAMRASAR